VEFAPEIVGNGTKWYCGAIEAIQGRFFLSKTDYIVFCVGAFAEMNEDGDGLRSSLINIWPR
jgi:hypothetical protein